MPDDPTFDRARAPEQGRSGALSRTRGYRIDLVPYPRKVRVIADGVVLAESGEAAVMRETRHAPVVYFPRSSVDFSVLTESERYTFCPFKGDASYWHFQGPSRRIRNIAWAYPHPYREVEEIAEYIAFDKSLVDDWLEEDLTTGALHTAPDQWSSEIFRSWLFKDAWNASSMQDFTASFGRALNAAGASVPRVSIGFWMLHPLLSAQNHVWERGKPGVETFEARKSDSEKDYYSNSPIRPICEGAEAVRYRLEELSGPFDDLPLLDELKAAGMTDYVGLPFVFSDGQINAFSIAADRAGGFTEQALKDIAEAAPVMARMVEVHAQRSTMLTLLDTYLGSHAGERINYGLIQRGDGDFINAVIWFCDLRDSTALADQLPPEEFLALLNQFFECMAGAVIDHEGTVLRFVGDAVLAIFPVEDVYMTEDLPPDPQLVCQAAIDAARQAVAKIDGVNQDRAAAGDAPLRYGIGLHIGEVLYGNVGAPDRLEFTVIGPSVNEAARLEAKTKDVDAPIVISKAFQTWSPEALNSIGEHRLRGVAKPTELFTLPEFAADAPHARCLGTPAKPLAPAGKTGH